MKLKQLLDCTNVWSETIKGKTIAKVTDGKDIAYIVSGENMTGFVICDTFEEAVVESKA